MKTIEEQMCHHSILSDILSPESSFYILLNYARLHESGRLLGSDSSTVGSSTVVNSTAVSSTVVSSTVVSEKFAKLSGRFVLAVTLCPPLTSLY
jgi:hypothetical protein